MLFDVYSKEDFPISAPLPIWDELQGDNSTVSASVGRRPCPSDIVSALASKILVPMSSGAARKHHIAKCERCSVGVSPFVSAHLAQPREGGLHSPRLDRPLG